MLGVRKTKNLFKGTVVVFILLSLCGFITTCDMPLGLGEPVDTVAPTINIMVPKLNQSFGTMVITTPVNVSGVWDDNMHIVRLTVVITDTRRNVVYTDIDFNYTINEDKTWSGTLFLPDVEGLGEMELEIKIFAFDNFGNQGADTVTIRVDVVAPWVEEAKIARHSNSYWEQSELQYLDFYREIINFNDPASYRNIQSHDIDYFQNESFTLKLRLDSNWTDVATSRLQVFNDRGERIVIESGGVDLNSEEGWGLIPSRQVEGPKNPQWDFNTEMLSSLLSSGPSYLEFEVWAWNINEWVGDWDTGHPREVYNQVTYRKQNIAGTCWYPETDVPLFNIERDSGSGQIVVSQGEPLQIQVTDDDKLKMVYAALIDKEVYLAKRGTDTEDQFHEKIRTNQDGLRDNIISTWSLTNFITSDTRNTTVPLTQNNAGEYRLILFACDDKLTPMFETEGTPVWSIYPPLMVDVQNPNSPIIIIESPAMENNFPDLQSGRNFNMSGYTIDKSGTQFVQIAWLPAGFDKSRSEALSAFQKTIGNAYNANGTPYVEDGFRIWKIPVGSNTQYILNNQSFVSNSFLKQFDIINDFMIDGVVENNTKLFFIHTRNISSDEIKTFRLTAYTELPAVTVNYPVRDNMIHSIDADLQLSMTVTPGKVGLKSGWQGIRIRDITNFSGDEVIADINKQNNYQFLGDIVESPPYGLARDYTRTFTRNKNNAANNDYFAEGSRKVYLFEAEDILGNKRLIELKVIMSSAPSLMYINSTFADNTYGAGTEILFNAGFSMPVNVDKQGGTGPRLKLFFTEQGNTAGAAQNRYADFVQSAGTIVTFRYTVQNNDLADKLYTAVDSIVLNGSSINFTNTQGEMGIAIIQMTAANQASGSLQALKSIGINGVRPRVTRAAFTQISPLYENLNHSGESFFNAGKTLTLELTVDKEVRISGTPQALLSWGTTATAYAQFSSIEPGNRVIKFTWDVSTNPNVGLSQVRWGTGTTSAAVTPWIQTTNGTITDNFGNPIDLNTLPTGNNLNGSSAPVSRAFIITTNPPEAALELYRTNSLGTQDRITGNDDILTNRAIYIKNTHPNANTVFWYSLAGGGSPVRLVPAAASGTLEDINAANSNSTAYQPSTYAVIAWLEDFAGNSGDRPKDNGGNEIIRNVTINSRAPELVAINCLEPNGRYSYGRSLTFNLVFSRQFIANINARVVMDLAGDGSAESNRISTITQAVTLNSSGTTIAVTFTVPNNKLLTNIKATRITFQNITDEYGNSFKDYSNAVTTENADWRPLLSGSSYNFSRSGLIIDSMGPQVTGWSPGAGPAYGTRYPNGIDASGEYVNGGVMSVGSNQITLQFNKEVFAQAGKAIIVRPYGNWGVPPILSNEDFNTLYNSGFVNHVNASNQNISIFNTEPVTSAQREIFQRRLKWLDPNGIPETNQTIRSTYTADQANAMLAERHQNNYYTYTTRGIVQSAGGLARPDVTAQWVLAFRHDIYEGIGSLREVFNAAEWKWQRLLSTSTAISNNTASSTYTVTITVPQTLQKGRIWEVIIEEGAFRDAAGNESAPISEGQYRFWSGGTETPVIRVDRYSQSDHFHGLFDADSNMFGAFGAANRPKVDTRIRIDCETPGASIYYDTIRTHFTPAAAGTGTNTSTVFTSTTLNTGDNFFNHPNINAGTVHTSNTTPNHTIPTANLGNNAVNTANNTYALRGANPGFANAWIGNIGHHWGMTQAESAAVPITKTDGYWTSLLVPSVSQTSGVNVPISQNGAILMSSLNAAGNAVLTSGRNYKTVPATGVAEYHASVFPAYTNNTTGRIYASTANAGTDRTEGHFFYAGDAYWESGANAAMNNRDASGDTDSRLFSGRRDYIVAAARKNQVSAGAAAQIGPSLAASGWDRDGVFKTTVLHRNPNGRTAANTTFPGTSSGTARMYLQGFDLPVNTSIAGFPLNEATAPFPVSGYQWLDYFTRQAWRVNTEAVPANEAARRADNNYIWVTWDIVTDWYQKGRTWTSDNGTGTGGSLFRDEKNYGSILCTYGAVNYRFEQTYWSNSGTGFR